MTGTERIITDGRGGTRIVEVGPPGPRGLPGANGSADFRRGFSFVPSPTLETIEGVDYQVFNLDAEAENLHEGVFCFADPLGPPKILIKPPAAVPDLATAQIFDLVMTTGPDREPGTEQWSIHIDFFGMIVDGTDKMMGAIQRRTNSLRLMVVPISPIILGMPEGDPFWMINPSSAALPPRAGAVIIMASPRDPSGLEADLRYQAANRSTVAVVVDSLAEELYLKIEPGDRLVQFNLAIEAAGDIDHYLHLRKVIVQSDGADDIEFLVKPSWFHLPGVISVRVGSVPGGQPFNINPHFIPVGHQRPGAYLSLHGTPDVYDAGTEHVIGSTWTVGRWVKADCATAIKSVRIVGADGGDTDALLKLSIVEALNGAPHPSATPVELGEVAFSATETWMDFVLADPYALDPTQLYILMLQSDSDLAWVRQPSLALPPGIEYASDHNNVLQGLGNDSTIYGTWPTALGPIGWRPYVLFELTGMAT